MKFSLQVLLLFLLTCLTHASVPEQPNWCPYKYQVLRPCGSAGIWENTCPGVPRPWCNHYNYVSVRRRPCGCMDGACRHRNMSCVLCSECDNCHHRGKEIGRDDYEYFNAGDVCERALCSFNELIVDRCTNPKPKPYGNCVYKREHGRYPKCCNWIRTC